MTPIRRARLSRPSPWWWISALVMLCPRLAIAVDATARTTFVTPEVKRAIDKGLAFIAKGQRQDGRLADKHFPAATTAIGVMAFLTNGELPGKGPYGFFLDRALTFLVTTARDPESGLISSRGMENASSMGLYEHAFCMTVLAEVYGEWNRGDLKDILETGSQLLMRCQDADGGFPYEPVSSRGSVDQPCAATAILAMRALRDAQQPVPQKVVNRAIVYLRRCARPDGSFAYDPTGRSFSTGPDEAVVRTGVGLLALWAMGDHQAGEIPRALRFLAAHPRLHPEWAYYGAYYQVRAMYQGGGKDWDLWYPRFQQVLLGRQNANGSFGGRSNQSGVVMDTAFAITALGIQKHLLPLFER